jgi:hypothetical protein
VNCHSFSSLVDFFEGPKLDLFRIAFHTTIDTLRQPCNLLLTLFLFFFSLEGSFVRPTSATGLDKSCSSLHLLGESVLRKVVRCEHRDARSLV